jgi:heat shock protein 5
MELLLVLIWVQPTRTLYQRFMLAKEDLVANYSSCVGVMQNGKVEILVNDQGNRITPSYVAFTDEERLVGDAAKNQYAANPVRTIFDIK